MWFGFICHYLMIISPPRIKRYLKNPAASGAGMFALHTNEQLVNVYTSKDQHRNHLLSSFHVAGKYFVHNIFYETHLLVMQLTAGCM